MLKSDIYLENDGLENQNGECSAVAYFETDYDRAEGNGVKFFLSI